MQSVLAGNLVRWAMTALANVSRSTVALCMAHRHLMLDAGTTLPQNCGLVAAANPWRVDILALLVGRTLSDSRKLRGVWESFYAKRKRVETSTRVSHFGGRAVPEGGRICPPGGPEPKPFVCQGPVMCELHALQQGRVEEDRPGRRSGIGALSRFMVPLRIFHTTPSTQQTRRLRTAGVRLLCVCFTAVAV